MSQITCEVNFSVCDDDDDDDDEMIKIEGPEEDIQEWRHIAVEVDRLFQDEDPISEVSESLPESQNDDQSVKSRTRSGGLNLSKKKKDNNNNKGECDKLDSRRKTQRKLGSGNKKKRSELVEDYRMLESSDDHQQDRFSNLSDRQRRRLAQETPEQRKRRLGMLSERWKRIKANETPEQRQHRLKVKREWKRLKMQTETPEQRQHRLQYGRTYHLQRRQVEKILKSQEERSGSSQSSLDGLNKPPRKRRPNKPKLSDVDLIPEPVEPVIRKGRAANPSEQWKQRLANETPEQRSKRLARCREYKRRKVENETAEQREHRLAVIRECNDFRFAHETPEQRKRRLEYGRQYYMERKMERLKALAEGGGANLDDGQSTSNHSS